jgi:hypothetical protein
MVGGAIAGVIRVPNAPSLGTASRTQQLLRGCQIGDNKMEYVIAVSVAVMMALYTLIIARCLKEPEWQ